MTDQKQNFKPVTVIYLRRDGTLYQKRFLLVSEREADFLVAAKNGKTFSFKKRENLAVLPGWKHEAPQLALVEQKLRRAVTVSSPTKTQEKTNPVVTPQKTHPVDKQLPVQIPAAAEELAARQTAVQKLRQKKLERGERVGENANGVASGRGRSDL